VDARLWQRHVSYLTKFVTKTHYADEVARLGIEGRLDKARAELKRVNAPGYLEELRGTLGANPLPKSAAQEQAELAITSSATNTPSARQTVAVT
jgi:hypothetical protein